DSLADRGSDQEAPRSAGAQTEPAVAPRGRALGQEAFVSREEGRRACGRQKHPRRVSSHRASRASESQKPVNREGDRPSSGGRLGFPRVTLRSPGLLGSRRVGLRTFLGLGRLVAALFPLHPFAVRLTRIVGYVPSRSLELERGARDQLPDLALASGTT